MQSEVHTGHCYVPTTFQTTFANNITLIRVKSGVANFPTLTKSFKNGQPLGPRRKLPLGNSGRTGYWPKNMVSFQLGE